MKISFLWLIISSVCVFPWCLLAQNSPLDYLDAHNAAREEVGVRPLKWDADLESYTLAELNKVIENCEPGSSHNYIMNAVLGNGKWKNLSGIQAVAAWVSEKKYYDEQTKSCVGGGYRCANYMQVITSISTHVGCARVMCNNGSIMIACSYKPPEYL